MRGVPAWLRRLRHRGQARADNAVIRASEYFDAKWYLIEYRDVAAAGLDPADHYLEHGAREGRDPGPRFSSTVYLRNHPDVAQAGLNPLLHYERHGKMEGRATGRLMQGNAGHVPLEVKEEHLRRCQKALEAFLVAGNRVLLPHAAAPLVSVVLVLYNKAEVTLGCLQALELHLGASAEVLIVDNASSDRTRELLARAEGARLFPQTENLHFLRGANLGARQARGRYLLFLNNDAIVEADAIPAACRVLDSQPDAGAAGGKILLLDGRVQEAGNVVWNNARTTGVGRGADPAAPEFAFRRDVDYCSGAFLLMRRDAFERLGGFDEEFAPAYYEDTDLCTRLWEAGMRVVYEPRAVIRHFESASSHGTAEATRLSDAHRERLLRRHGQRLAAMHRPPGQMLEARMRFDGPRVLFIDDGLPLPAMGSGYPRAREIVRSLCEAGAFVTHYCLNAVPLDFAEIYQAIPPEVELAEAGVSGNLGMFLESRRAYYDLLIVSRPHGMQALLTALRELPGVIGEAPIVYDAEAIVALREQSRAALTGQYVAPAQAAIGAELALARTARVVLAVSAPEAARFRAGGHLDVRVLGHALVPAATPEGFADRRDFLFVGRLLEPASPNADSMRWFVSEVMPALDGLMGQDWALDVVGAAHPDLVSELQGTRVRFHGRVADLAAFYARARVFIAPTRFAAGIPHKVHEAAARGLPVVGTRLIAGQLGWTDGEQLLAADDAQDFAATCARLYREPELWNRLRAHALARVQADCDPRSFAITLHDLLRELATPPARRR